MWLMLFTVDKKFRMRIKTVIIKFEYRSFYFIENEQHVTTYAFSLELNDENIYRQQFLENRLLKIENIESFYNYSNPDNDFKLITSVLSDNISFEFSDETITAKKSKTKLNDHKKDFVIEKTVTGVELLKS